MVTSRFFIDDSLTLKIVKPFLKLSYNSCFFPNFQGSSFLSFDKKFHLSLTSFRYLGVNDSLWLQVSLSNQSNHNYMLVKKWVQSALIFNDCNCLQRLIQNTFWSFTCGNGPRENYISEYFLGFYIFTCFFNITQLCTYSRFYLSWRHEKNGIFFDPPHSLYPFTHTWRNFLNHPFKQNLIKSVKMSFVWKEWMKTVKITLEQGWATLLASRATLETN